MSSQWTAERDDMLRRMIGEGALFSEAAAALGVTRSAVGGRAMRLGLKSTNKAWTRHVKVPRVRKPRVKVERPPAPKVLTREEAVMRCAAVEPLHVGLMELEHHHCRYLYGDAAPYTFCGHPKTDGWAYCAAHAAICVNNREA